ncbi:hypothetical protein [Arthrobacter glacialis]|uniref:Uncharacterized protein n=1 Tax=Arthrobacter glacialis TaxID=1664 RepID=A0A2S3ZUG4_ARTGL|nr:hypothetical protein [Arthrobacter glacialis]POH72487.1 hypothetical protein CVS27_15270 [Arthrobacter glacialis]
MTGDHSHHLHGSAATPSRSGADPEQPRTWRQRFHALWHSIVAVIGFLVGLLPHVLHHIGLLAGTALVAGSGGTALFGALGLLASVPLLLRLHKRFGTWIAPAIGLLIFAAMFSLSAFVIGPAISGTGGDLPPGPVPGVEHPTDHPSGH